MANERLLPGLGAVNTFKGFADKGSDDWHLWNDVDLLLVSVLLGRNVLSITTSLPGSPSDGDIYIVPSGDTNGNDVAVYTRTDYGVSGTAGWVYYTPQEGWTFRVVDESIDYQWTGSAWAQVINSGAYDIQAAFTTTPTSSQVIETIMCPRAISFGANFADSLGVIGTNPTSSFVMSVKDDGVEIGTVTVSTGGTFTFATTSGTAKVVAAGSQLTIVAPASVDATAANMTMTFAGTA